MEHIHFDKGCTQFYMIELRRFVRRYPSRNPPQEQEGGSHDINGDAHLLSVHPYIATVPIGAFAPANTAGPRCKD